MSVGEKVERGMMVTKQATPSTEWPFKKIVSPKIDRRQQKMLTP